MNAVIYARYSSDKQTEQSIEGQLRDCYEYAEKQGITVVKEYIDRAMTGKYDDRPQFQKMIADSAKKQFQYVIVYKLDRFARNRYDSAIYKHKLKKNGVKVLSAMEQISDSPEGVILEAVLEASAEYYSLELAQKVRRGMRESALKANSTGGTIPLGYKLSDKKLVIDEASAPAIKYIFESYAAGVGKKEIADALNSKGFKTAGGNGFTINSFNQILTNKKYTGVFTYKDIEVDGGCPALIDKDTFNKVGKAIQRTKKAPARSKAKATYQLQGKVFCGMCGAPMIGESGHSKSKAVYNYYACANRKKHKNCKKKNERKDFIEWYVVEQTVEYVLNPTRIDYIAERVVAQYSDDFNADKIKDLEKRLKQVDRELDKCVNILLETDKKSIIVKVNQKVDDLELQKNSLEIEISKIRIGSKINLKQRDVVSWIQKFCQGDLMDPEFRERIIDTFINAIYLYDDKVVIYYNIKDSKQVSYIEMLESTEEPGAECSDFTRLAPPTDPKNNTYYHYFRGGFSVTIWVDI